MGVRADWSLPDVIADDVDPFQPQARIEDVGVPIRLNGRRADLDARVLELVQAEAALFDRGITCAVKDRPDTCCHACPLRDHGGPVELCAVGLEQEQVLTTLASRHDSRDR